MIPSKHKISLEVFIIIKKILSILPIILLFNNITFSAVLFNSTSIEDNIWYGLGSYKFNFKFKNIGRNSIRIVSVTTSCACTVARLKKDKYDPGESGEINGIFNIGDRRGFLEQEITVHTDDVSQSQIMLRLKIKVLADYEISHRLIYWNKDGEYTTKVAILNINNPNWNLKDIKYNKSKFMIEVSKDDGKYIIKVTPLSTNFSLRDLIKVELKNKDNEIRFLAVHVLIK